MQKSPKTEQLQIRVSPAQKLVIKKQADQARMTMSEWILNKVLPVSKLTFRTLIEELAVSDQPSYAFAELLELLEQMTADDFETATSELPEVPLSPYWANYLAAAVEQAAAAKQVAAPSWTRTIEPLAKPVFGSTLESVRLHLLVNSPPAFLARNIFIDATVGDRV